MQVAHAARLKEALAGTNTTKEKGSQVADGILSLTPDTPDVIEWRKKGRGVDCVETTSKYLEDGDSGPLPHELYGKFTWKIDNFSDISKRELRSNVFEVGSYKWYILVYPQGCDVCNHLSLFLCVADYDKLLPGWSHFAQFTIAVVNNDPKKSKYSDTLHRFCKKEHDWGWKKFMELSKVLDGFTVDDQLIIKAQVQVIRDTPLRPFRCLDPQYRRELVRVYLTNVEIICRRFIEEKREQLWNAVDDSKQFVSTSQFQSFWRGLSDKQKHGLLREKASVILQRLVKRFFNEKEVTSTLVMDALYAGCKQLEEATSMKAEGKAAALAPAVKIDAKRNIFYIEGDALQVWNRAASEAMPSLKDKAIQADSTGARNDDLDAADTSEPDDRRLAELGRRTIEMFTIAHIFSHNLQSAFREEQSLRKQEELIREEEEAERENDERNKKKAEIEKEKRAKKKEKKKQKKEVERQKKQEEDDEKAKIENEKRVEAERKQEEANQKRREEEERLRAQERRTAAAKARVSSESKPQDKPKEKVKAPKSKEAESDKPSSSSSVSTDTSESGDDWQLGSTGRNARGVAALASASKPDDDEPANGVKAPWAGTHGRLAAADNIPGAPSTRHSGEAGASTSSSLDSRDALLAQISQLEARVLDLEAQLADKDSEALALRTRLHELAVLQQSQAGGAEAGARAAVGDSQSDASGPLLPSAPSGAALAKVGSGPAWSAASLGSTSDCSEAGTPSHVAGHSGAAAAQDARGAGQQYAPNSSAQLMYRASSAEAAGVPLPPLSPHQDKQHAAQGRANGPASAAGPHLRAGIPPSGPSRPGAAAAKPGATAAAAASMPTAARQPVGQHAAATKLASVKTGGQQPGGAMMAGSLAPGAGARNARGVAKPGKPPGAAPAAPSVPPTYTAAPRQSAWSSGAPPPPPPPPPPHVQNGPGHVANGLRTNGSIAPPAPPAGSYRAAAVGGSGHFSSDALESMSGHLGNGIGDTTPRSIAADSPVSSAKHPDGLHPGMEDFAHMGLITDLLE